MRLIDADAGVDYLQMMAQNCRNFGMHNTAGCYDMLVSLLGDTGHFPTIDAVPVVHARWVLRCRYIATEIWEWRCSACGELPPGPNQLAYELRYCPRCGAKMDAKEAES